MVFNIYGAKYSLENKIIVASNGKIHKIHNKLLNNLGEFKDEPSNWFAKFSTQKPSEIQNFSKDTDNSNEYLILTLKQELETSLKSLENSYTKVKYLDTNRPKYNIQAKLYDYLFIEALANDRESFFKKCCYQ